MARCFPRLQGGCLALPFLQFLLPWRLSCAVAGAPPTVARFSGGRRPLDPGSERGAGAACCRGRCPSGVPPAGCRRRWGDLGALALPLLPRRADGGSPFPLLDVSCILDSLSMIGCGGGEGGTCCRPRSTSARATGFSPCLPRFLHPAAAFLPPFCLWSQKGQCSPLLSAGGPWMRRPPLRNRGARR